MLKNLYISQLNFLPFNFDPKYFYIRTTNYPRTQLSAESLFLGLYNTTNPPNDMDCTTNILNIYTVDSELENMYPNSRWCSGLDSIEKKWVSSVEFQNFQKSVIEPLSLELSQVFGIPLAELDEPSFTDCLQSHVCHNMSLPSGLTQGIYDTTVDSSTWYYKGLQFTLSQNNNNWASVAMGAFVGEMGRLLDEVVSGASSVKMALYSGHDTTLMPLLAAYGVWNGIWPPYASLLRVHLLQDNTGNFFVELIYNNGNPLLVPGCPSTPCPYSSFKAISSSIISASKECHSNRNGRKFGN